MISTSDGARWMNRMDFGIYASSHAPGALPETVMPNHTGRRAAFPEQVCASDKVIPNLSVEELEKLPPEVLVALVRRVIKGNPI